ncbi:MAG TPA: hypothetical protein VHI10_11580, partial [Mycobacterium sp.]|nr:hypothetical protein [Mycobacterium sp.]
TGTRLAVSATGSACQAYSSGESNCDVSATVLEGIRMADAVADTSQFDSPLLYAWQADPVADTASLVPVLGEAGKQVLDQHGWLAGYRATYADQPRQPDGSVPPVYVGLSIMLLRFPDEAAAAAAAAALEAANWTDLARTVAVPLPKHPDVNARYTPGTGALMVDAPIGPFVVHLMLEAPPQGIETLVGELDPVLDAERTLLKDFKPTPPTQISALPRDPDGLLARMVTTDPDRETPVSVTFAVYGPTGALRDQPPSVRKDKLYRKWGVDRLAVSGDQHLYRVRDHQAALDMLGEFTAQRAGREHEIEADPNIPDERCFQSDNPAPGEPAFVCRVVVNNFYTSVRANTASNVKEKAAAQYALLASM